MLRKLLSPPPVFIQASMCGSRKHPYHHQRGTSEILRGRGILKAKNFKGMYQPKLQLPEGWGIHTKKNPPWGEYGYFLEQHNLYPTQLPG